MNMSIKFDLLRLHTCHRFWDPAEARFDTGCLTIISSFAPIFATLVLFGYSLRPFLRRRLRWFRSFASEVDQEEAELYPQARKSWTRWTITLFLLSCIGLILSVATALVPPRSPFQLFTVVPWAVSTLIVTTNRPKSAPTPLLLLFCITLACRLIASFDANPTTRASHVLTITESCTAFFLIIVILSMPLRNPDMNTSDICQPFDPPTFELRSPEDNLTLWQFMTVSWMTPLIARGYTRQLHDGDVWKLPFEFQHTRLHILFRELKGSVIRRLLVANGVDLMTTSLLGIIELGANFSVPVLLQLLLRSIEGGNGTKRPAVTYAALILTARLIACQSSVFSLWYCRRSYERSRGEMITMIYEKTLKRKAIGFQGEKDIEKKPQNTTNESEEPNGTDSVSNNKTSKKHYLWKPWGKKNLERKPRTTQPPPPASMGKILNLMRNDVYEVAQRFWEFPNIITKPLTLIVSIVLIWRLLGWPCLIGMISVSLAQIINAVLVRLLLRYERIRRTATDVKLQVTSQFVEAIRHLRWYDWQNQWLEKILSARQRELQLRVITSLWNIAITTTNLLASGMFPVAAFYGYTIIAAKPLTVDIAFPALQLFALLETSLTELPGLITVLLNASIAARRIQDFMSEADKEDTYLARGSTDVTLALQNASFAWPGTAAHVLNNITLKFPPGFTVVVGKVGQGKTALLQAILGELDKTAGEVFHPDEMVGYCAQSPWLQSMNIRENILFSAPFDEQRYRNVLDACALTPDLANLKHGDLSSLGENGIGLSGGQRARVALARAVYSKARILLLDDPISALDHNTAESIVRRLFRGALMEGRTVILVTHRTQLCCQFADQVVEIRSGEAYILSEKDLTAENYSALDDPNSPGGHEEEETAKLNDSQLDGAVPDKFIEEEHRAQGGVMASVYWQYVKAGKLRWWAALIALFALFRLVRLGNYWFLKQWGEAYGEPQEQSAPSFFDRFPSPEDDVKPWLIGFLLLAIANTTMFFLSDGVLLVIVYTAGKRLFKDVMIRVSHATFRFYDVTPVGRLMNRLTSDIGTLDGNISDKLQNVAWHIIAWVSAIVVIASVTPLFLIFSIGLTAWFAFIFFRFLPTSQSLRRLEMVSLSPLMSNFGALLDGLTTVRAFRAQAHFQDRVIAVTDAFQKMDHFYWSLQAWLMYRFDALSAVSTFVLTLLALYSNHSSGLVAFVLTAASNFVLATHAVCKGYGQLQMDFVSVERVVELLHLEEEPLGTVDPPASWPSFDDSIVFENVTIKYAPDLDPALIDVSFRIPGRSTVAVIGRTGSGKSTLALALLATILPQPGGKICIGNQVLGEVNVHSLRQRVSFVAQDPVLFPGTIRQNLDPLDEHTDDECIVVLHRVLGAQWNLEFHVDGGGRNLSQGQRQLVGLARAVLRRSSIVILDEATASIDIETAMSIQQVLRDELKESTVITVAHRLEAVKDADYCIILDKGRVKTQGPADELMK